MLSSDGRKSIELRKLMDNDRGVYAQMLNEEGVTVQGKDTGNSNCNQIHAIQCGGNPFNFLDFLTFQYKKLRART